MSNSPTPSPTLALLTDFGIQDGYAGILKGAIQTVFAAHNISTVPVIDITHQIPSQQVAQGAWVLQTSKDFFPKGTVFVCVVDPKVGTSRQRGILVHCKAREQFFIAPDNGLLTPVLQAGGDKVAVYEITNDKYYRQCPFADDPAEVSHTFHGRDIYAPVAAHLAGAIAAGSAGKFLQDIGSEVSDAVQLTMDPPRQYSSEKTTMVEGTIRHIDVFGNLITDIPNTWVPDDADLEARIVARETTWFTRQLETYAQGEGKDHTFVLPGSNGTIELARYQASAKDLLDAAVGDMVALSW
ncbi:MAG: SAM-dependent chlorinase/fluorinase [Vampirovibrio sp.]|nr:SAM-dependent chlorinase/fluorinase [Vampirovibrio sp.]